MSETSAPFFSPDWWDQVIAAWNASPHTDSLAGLGAITFKILDEEAAACLEWDAAGQARRLEAPAEGAPGLGATREHWRQYIAGEFKAAVGVMTGKLKFEGNMAALLPFAEGVQQFVEISREAAGVA